MKRIINIFIAFSLILSSSVAVVRAVDMPNFPACPNPSGDVIANYDSGKHGVPGDPTEFEGSDKVVKINDTQVVQCLCPPSGSGVQTLWWKNTGLSQSDISILLKEGWIRIPNGSLWGLDNAEYFAKNSNFICGEKGGGGGETNNGGGSSVNGTSTSNSGSSESSSSVGSTGQILGASTLAATGSWRNIIAALGVAVLAFIMGQRLYKSTR